ncbi:MAG: RluA family pseudouridine synthase [Bacteroidota bacterium]|nr:RluA family pseudouridine synthase [Bacteroidota bacterium]
MTENREFDEILDDEQKESQTFEHHRFKADPGQSLLRLDRFLVVRLQNSSRNKIQAAIDAGNVLVNGKARKSNYKVKPGDEVSIEMDYPKRDIELIPEDIPLDVVYEDESLIVVNKPAGMVVHPSYGHYTGTLLNALVYRFKHLPMFEGGNERPGLVHRIDKDTSGLLVVAKTEHALTHLAKQFFDKTSHRKYIAMVWGLPNPAEGTITGNVGRSLKNRKMMYVFPDEEFGKHAVTHYKVIEELGYVNLVECKLETGRTHQIRVHFQHIGHPLFNDATYGGDKVLRGTVFTKYKQFVQNCFTILPRQALHAKELGFIHPKTGKQMMFDSEIPEDMRLAIEKWRAYVSNREG